MEIASSAPNDSMAAPSLHAHVLRRLITFCFASAHGPAYTFGDTFHDFAGAYFSLSLDVGDLLRGPAVQEQAVDALVQVFEEAVATGHLAPLSVPTRLGAVMVLTSMASLQQEVADGALPPAEVADLAATMLFEGVEA